MTNAKSVEKRLRKHFMKKLELDNIHISTQRLHTIFTHRVKRVKNIKSTKARTIVSHLLSFKGKKLVMKNVKKVKNMSIFIDRNFCTEMMEYCKQLLEEVKELRRKGNIAYLNYRL